MWIVAKKLHYIIEHSQVSGILLGCLGFTTDGPSDIWNRTSSTCLGMLDLENGFQ